MNDLDGRLPLEVRAGPQTSVINHVVDGQNPVGEFWTPTAKREGTCCAQSQWRIPRSTTALRENTQRRESLDLLSKTRGESFGQLNSSSRKPM